MLPLAFDEVVLDAAGRMIAYPAAVAMVDAVSSSRPLGSDNVPKTYPAKEGGTGFFARFPNAARIGIS